jgi:uncharacterized protein YoxC
MASPPLNGKHGEMITQMYAKIGVLINDVSNIKDGQKEMKNDISKIHDNVTDLKVQTKGYSEKIKAVSDDICEHKKEHDKAFGKVIGVLTIVTTIVSAIVSLVFNFFKR